jgi:hypothetical protein
LDEDIVEEYEEVEGVIGDEVDWKRGAIQDVFQLYRGGVPCCCSKKLEEFVKDSVD